MTSDRCASALHSQRNPRHALFLGAPLLGAATGPSEAAEKFYRELAAQGKKVRVGMEASGHARWFERVLAELNFELRAGSGRAISRTQDTGRCWRSWLVFREANRPPSNLRRCVGMIFILMLTIGSWKTKLWRCNREISSAWSELGSR